MADSTTGQDLILGALRFINAYAPGDPLAADDAEDARVTLNDLLDSLSTDSACVFASAEDVFTFTPGQYIYTIGNYDAGTFAGAVTSGSAVITGVTVPSNLTVGGDLTGTGIAAGATILSFNAGAGTVTMSAVATATPGTPQQIAYTIPGNFKTTRPLRITSAFTRITTSGSGLDYGIEIVDQLDYNSIGFKSIQGPWPIKCWYNATYPLGTLYFYQNPTSAGELHLFADRVLSNVDDLTTPIFMPQGYSRYLKRKLARELAPEYGKTWTADHERLAKEAEDYVKSLNQVPVIASTLDANLRAGPVNDAGWILHGGFGR